MTRDEQLRRLRIELSHDGRVILAWIATDMLHENINILTLEAEYLRVHSAKNATIAVATDSTNRTKLIETVNEFNTADISCMPDFIAGFKIFKVTIIPEGMGVTNNAYCFHCIQ